MSLSSRLSVVSYFDNVPANVHDHCRDEHFNMWTAFSSVREYQRCMLQERYGIARDISAFDTTIRLHDSLRLHVVSSARTDVVYVRKIGVPVARADLTRWLKVARDKKKRAWQVASSLAYVYAFETEDRRAVHCYARVLETGSFVKISPFDINTHRSGARIREIIHDSTMAQLQRPAASSAASGFDTICKNTLKRLYTVLNQSASFSTESASLRDILRRTYAYNEMYVLRHREVAMVSKYYVLKNGRYEYRSVSKSLYDKQNIRGNSKLSPEACAVARCSLAAKLSDVVNGKSQQSDWMIRFRKLHHAVVCEDDDENRDLSYNFCANHGELIASAWFLLNQKQVWASRFYNSLSMSTHGNVPQCGTAAETLYVFLKKKHDLVDELKRQCDAALTCVNVFCDRMEHGIWFVRNRRGA